MERLYAVAQDQNVRLNKVLTVRVPGHIYGAEGTRYVHKITRSLFQAFRRRGHPAIAVTVYELKRKSRDLHAHVLVHVPNQCVDLMKQRLAPPELHVRETDENAVKYVTKQRWARSSGRDRFYEKGEYIPGPRVSFTKDATAILRGEPLCAPQRTSPNASRQIGGRLSPTALRTRLKSVRAEHGLTQERFYGLIGISRAHGANVEAGRCRFSLTTMQAALWVMSELGRGKLRSRIKRTVAK